MKIIVNRNIVFYIAVVLVLLLLPSIIIQEYGIASAKELTEQTYQAILLLIVIYPLISVISGAICYLLKANLYILLGISIGTMIYVVITDLNDSAFVYVVIYTLLIIASFKLLQFVKKRHFT